ncbi:hypothetical protein D9M68_185950 [compost metagenome]
MTPPGRVIERIPEAEDQQDHHHHTEREHSGAHLEADTEDVEHLGDGRHIGLADRRIGRIDEVRRHDHVPGTERDDERRKLDPGDEEAVEKAAGAADDEAEEDRDRCRKPIGHGAVAHDDRRKHHDHPDRKIDTGGQDHQGLRGAEDTDDGDLLEDEGQRVGREELPADGNAEDQNCCDKHDERHGRRRRVQEMLDLLDRGLVMRIERRDLRRTVDQDFFEFLGWLCGCVGLAHGPSSREPRSQGVAMQSCTARPQRRGHKHS